MTPDIQPHANHEHHLCHLHNIEHLLTDNPEAYKALVRNPNYICLGCGRVAAGAKNLCAPRPLNEDLTVRHKVLDRNVAV